MSSKFTQSNLIYGFRSTNNIPLSNRTTNNVEEKRLEKGPIVKRYCNYPISVPESVFTASDLSDFGLKFRGLFVLTRHGDRAPLSKFSDHLHIPFCGVTVEEDMDLYNSYVESITSSKEQQQEVLPPKLSKLRKYPPGDECRPGHLTQLGVVQLLKLGRHLRSLYADIWPFDSKNTNFYIASTTFSRTYQSCLAFVSGFLGSKADDLNLLASESVTFCTESWCQCPNMAKLNEHFHDFQHAFYKSRGEHVFPVIDTMKDVLKNSSLYPMTYFDHVMGYSCHGERMPCITEDNGKVCINHNMMETLGTFLHLSYADLYKTELTGHKSIIEALPSLVAVRKLLISVKENREINGFTYFSGHDVTLVPLLAVLGVFDGRIPPYASSFRVEIFEVKSSGKFLLRFVYNGADLTKNVQLCKGDQLQRYGKYEFCDSKVLLDFIEQYLDAKNNPTEKFQKICHSEDD